MGYWIKTSTYAAHVNASDDLSPETDAALHAVMRAAYRRLRDPVARKYGRGGRRARRRRGIREMREWQADRSVRWIIDDVQRP